MITLNGRVCRPYLLAFLVLLPALPANAADVDLKIGALSFNAPYAKQAVSVTNNTTSAMQSIQVECGFLQGDTVLASGSTFLRVVQASEMAFGEVIASIPPQASSVTRAQCRVVRTR